MKQMSDARGQMESLDMIAKIELWITEGAKFDGISSKADIERVVNVARAQRSTHEELTADRAKLSEAHWRLGSPGIKASKVESKNFMAMGDVGHNTLADIGERADAIAPKVAAILKADADQPLGSRAASRCSCLASGTAIANSARWSKNVIFRKSGVATGPTTLSTPTGLSFRREVKTTRCWNHSSPKT